MRAAARDAAAPPARWALGRAAPGGSPIPIGALRRLLLPGDAEAELRAGLASQVGAATLTLHASGREALRVAFAHLAERSGRREVAIPAYVCFSVPAAAVAAGLSVRLVDVDERGWLDPASLARLPLERIAAVVIANLFGVAEPMREVLEIARASGVAVVDDAAQALGARSEEGPAGGRGDVGVLSFGRGKPLSALGGGALAWPGDAPASAAQPRVAPERVAGALRALAYDLARWPLLLGLLSRIPVLRIGHTVYEPGFARGAISGPALGLARALLPDLAADAHARTQVARRLAAALRRDTPFRPLPAEPPEAGVHPRLAVLAPNPAERARALAALRPLGASQLYPSTLAHVDALRPHLLGDPQCPGAERLAERLLTLPTHARARIDAIASLLAETA